jgi:signal transduction histidine kinase
MTTAEAGQMAIPVAGRRASSRFRTAARYLLVSGATGILSLLTALACVLVLQTSIVRIGLPLWAPLARWIRRLTAYERRRAGKLLGEEIQGSFDPVTMGPLLPRLRTAIADRNTPRVIGWLLAHAILAVTFVVLPLGLPLSALRSIIEPLVWLFQGKHGSYVSIFAYRVDSWPLAVITMVVGLILAVLVAMALPAIARAEARLARALLSPRSSPRLAARVAELTATRAAALEAHGAELRRIERDLHDGTQARMVAVVMQLGIAERTMRTDPERSLDLIRQARDAATGSLAELREVVRSIYPPILDDRGLDGAVSALAARCPIPCTVQTQDMQRAPAAVEAAAYFVIAESLTNIAKHSHAEQAEVRLRTTQDTLVIEIEDDGQGGASENSGTGLAGIRRRVEAFDGAVTLSSPVGGPTRITAELPCGS